MAQEKPKKEPEIRKNKSKSDDDNVVYVGKKPVMTYVMAVLTQFNNEKEVIIKARGVNISRAVDCAEIVKRRFAKVKEPTDVLIGTEELEGNDGKPMNVSTIEVTLVKI